MSKVTVKYKDIVSCNFNNNIDTEDTRYNLKISKKKLVKWLIKNNFRFSLGIRGVSLIDNLDYIEVWSDGIFVESRYDRTDMAKSFFKKYSK